MAIIDVIPSVVSAGPVTIRRFPVDGSFPKHTSQIICGQSGVEPRFKTPDRAEQAGILNSTGCRHAEMREMTRPSSRSCIDQQLHADLVSLVMTVRMAVLLALSRLGETATFQQQTSGRGTLLPLSFAPARRSSFDWSETGRSLRCRTKLQVAHFKLSYSALSSCRA